MHYIWYILWPTLSFKSKTPQNLSAFFDFSLLELRVAKNRAPDFWLRFHLLRHWPILSFCFLWNRYLKYKVLHNIKTAQLELENCTLNFNPPTKVKENPQISTDFHWFKMPCLTYLVFSYVYCFFLKRWNCIKIFVLHE